MTAKRVNFGQQSGKINEICPSRLLASLSLVKGRGLFHCLIFSYV